MDCEKLREIAPSCFEKFGVISIQELPDYAKAYACLHELSRYLNVPWIWVGEDIINRVMWCRKQPHS